MTTELSTVEGQVELNEVFRHLTPLLLKSPMKSMAPMMAQEDTKPSKKAKGNNQPRTNKGDGKGKGKGKKSQKPTTPDADPALTDLVKSMGQLVLRVDNQQRLMLAESSFIIFLDSKPQGVLAQILQFTAQWKEEMTAGTQTCSLKALLWKILIQSLLQRVQMVEKATGPFLDQCVEAHVRTREGHWPFVQWNQETSKMVVVNKPAMKVDALQKKLQVLEASIDYQDVLLEFRALHNQGTYKDQQNLVLPWRLQVNWRHEEIYQILHSMLGLNVWSLLGARLKQCTTQPSALSQQVSHALRSSLQMLMDWTSCCPKCDWTIPVAIATPMPRFRHSYGVLERRLISNGPCLGRSRQTLLPCSMFLSMTQRAFWPCCRASLSLGMGMVQLMLLSLCCISWLGADRHACLAHGQEDSTKGMKKLSVLTVEHYMFPSLCKMTALPDSCPCNPWLTRGLRNMVCVQALTKCLLCCAYTSTVFSLTTLDAGRNLLFRLNRADAIFPCLTLMALQVSCKRTSRSAWWYTLEMPTLATTVHCSECAQGIPLQLTLTVTWRCGHTQMTTSQRKFFHMKAFPQPLCKMWFWCGWFMCGISAFGTHCNLLDDGSCFSRTWKHGNRSNKTWLLLLLCRTNTWLWIQWQLSWRPCQPLLDDFLLFRMPSILTADGQWYNSRMMQNKLRAHTFRRLSCSSPQALFMRPSSQGRLRCDLAQPEKTRVKKKNSYN